jgi:hypothetical protein
MDVVTIARCPEHGLHGSRARCFECGEEVEQVYMAPVGDGPPAGRPRRDRTTLVTLEEAVKHAQALAIAALEHAGFTGVAVSLNAVCDSVDPDDQRSSWVIGRGVVGVSIQGRQA